ncbi:hypothetical protein DL93DRAFT_2074251 [Clavulina sp. PMI_390]|nr:hypothetical protein DL93DRAFT_2074251 [Clavulina sp. PMI_390]
MDAGSVAKLHYLDHVIASIDSLNIRYDSSQPVDRYWLDHHAHLPVPSHNLGPRLKLSSIPESLHSEMILALQDDIASFHLERSNSLKQACSDILATSSTSQTDNEAHVLRFIHSAQKAFISTVQELEDTFFSACSSLCIPQSVKQEQTADVQLMPHNTDPKAYHHILEHIFEVLPNPTQRDKQEFCQSTGLSYDYVTHWFQNRRQRGAVGGRTQLAQRRQLLAHLGLDDATLEDLDPDDLEILCSVNLDAVSDDANRAPSPPEPVPDSSSEAEEDNDADWESDSEAETEVSSPRFSPRTPSLTRSVSFTSATSRDSSLRSLSPDHFSPTQTSISSHFNFQRSPSPSAPSSLPHKAGMLSDFASFPTLSTPLPAAPYRIGSWRTNPEPDFADTLSLIPSPGKVTASAPPSQPFVFGDANPAPASHPFTFNLPVAPASLPSTMVTVPPPPSFVLDLPSEPCAMFKFGEPTATDANTAFTFSLPSSGSPANLLDCSIDFINPITPSRGIASTSASTLPAPMPSSHSETPATPAWRTPMFVIPQPSPRQKAKAIPASKPLRPSILSARPTTSDSSLPTQAKSVVSVETASDKARVLEAVAPSITIPTSFSLSSTSSSTLPSSSFDFSCPLAASSSSSLPTSLPTSTPFSSTLTFSSPQPRPAYQTGVAADIYQHAVAKGKSMEISAAGRQIRPLPSSRVSAQ